MKILKTLLPSKVVCESEADQKQLISFIMGQGFCVLQVPKAPVFPATYELSYHFLRMTCAMSSAADTERESAMVHYFTS